jgi:pyruvate/2-oxoglutarate dehydrogenase complex dihydrolipoamide acyltransferase (E2) component/uncharacterized OsmC-like protein
MSSRHAVVMPQLGQAMEFGTITQWLVAEGTQVTSGQAIALVETDKASYELEATAAGTIRRFAAIGAEVAVGEAVAQIDDGAAASSPVQPQTLQEVQSPVGAARPVAPRRKAGRPLASPKARALAPTVQVDLGEVLSRRADGLIVAHDVELAAAARRASAPAGGSGAIPLNRLRRTAADRLARSWQQAPHFVQMIEVDASRLSQAITAIREGRLGATFNDILIKVAADTLARFPDLNARFADGGLVMSEAVVVGLAVSTDQGLTVPVLRNVAQRSLAEVANASADLVARAREGRLAPSDFGAGSLTVSNLGRYGVAFGTPVLNLDEPILIFVGAIDERPVGQIVLRPMTTLSVCFDHRVVDGLRAAQFSQALKAALEALDGIIPAPAFEPELNERELLATSKNRLAVDVQARGHRWVVDEPQAIGGEDRGPDPVTLALGSLLSCMIVAFKLVARRRGVAINKVEARLAATPKGKVKQIEIGLDIWSSAASADVQKMLAPAKAMCLVNDMLRSDLPIAVNLTVHPLD